MPSDETPLTVKPDSTVNFWAKKPVQELKKTETTPSEPCNFQNSGQVVA